LPAMAAGQSLLWQLADRYRRQASSHSGFASTSEDSSSCHPRAAKP
jgi:hypothetical protein